MQKAFAAVHPEVDIKRVYQAEMNNIIKVALTGDTGPEVFQRDIPPSYHQPLVDANLVVAMDEYYQKLPNLQKVFGWAKKRATINGKIWGVPHEVEFIPIYYNKPLLAKVGVSEVKLSTWDDFLNLCKTLKGAGIQPLALAGQARSQPGHLFSLLLMCTLGKDGFEKILYGDDRWDQPAVIEAADRMKQLLDLEYLPKELLALEMPAVQAAFASDRYAMWSNGTWALAAMETSKKDNPNFDYDYFIPPVINTSLKGPQIAGGIGGGFSISQKAKDKDLAATWLDFLMSPDAQKIWNEVFMQAAPTTFDPTKANVKPVPAKALALIAKGEELGYNVSVVIPSNVVEVYWNGLGGILSSQLTTKDWAAQMQTAWEKAKSEGKVPKA
ncbi:MAG: extracellular solute-binding protein [Chloroflexi bacterium]|nr:extracellular solute-binding protein [Chloroflexota bacterium]